MDRRQFTPKGEQKDKVKNCNPKIIGGIVKCMGNKGWELKG